MRTLGCVRFVYNWFLSLCIDSYRFTGRKPSCYDCTNMLNELKRIFPFLKECDSIALQQSLRHLDTAYKNFFEHPEAGFPRFKSKRAAKHSYTTMCVNGNISIEDGYIKLPKLGRVKMRQHRNIPEEYILKSATVTMRSDGKFYVSVLFECDSQAEEVTPKSFLGLDYASSGLYVDSDGNVPGYPGYFRKAEEKLAREQRRLSKMKRGSRNYEKQKRKLANLHAHVANQRKDFLHKLSKHLADKYDCIGIENLDMRAQSNGLRLGKSVHDNGWGMFTRMLSYKMERQGKQLVKVSRWYPSTKTCSACGNIRPVALSERTYVCPKCGLVIGRDKNAAINIREEAKRLVCA